MTALDTDDLAVVTGPLTMAGLYHAVWLAPGEVVRVLRPESGGGYAFVLGLSSGIKQWIDASSLTPLSEIHKDTSIEWGATPTTESTAPSGLPHRSEDEVYVRLCGTHDYVYTEDE